MKYLSGKKRINNDKDYFEVEKIITRKVDGQNKFYLIKWVGYPLVDCSWEPISHLQKISDMVETFDQNFPASIDKKRLRKYFDIVPVGRNVVDKALALEAKDFEDALQFYAAEQAEADCVVTRNTKHFDFASTIEVLEPKDFLSKYFPEEL